MDSSSLKRFAEYLPFLISLAVIGGILFGGIVISRWDYSVRGLSIAIPFVIAAAVLAYLFRHPQEIGDDGPLFGVSRFTLYRLYAVVYMVSIVLLIAGFDRHYYLVMLIGLFLILFVGIFSRTVSVPLTLCGIILTMMNIIYGITCAYPLFFSTTDVMGHIFMASVTYLSGHGIPVDLSPSYASFPLYHIFIAESAHILNLPIQQALFLVTCPAYALSVVFIYLIFTRITGNPRLSLFTCLVFSMTGVVLSEGVQMITRSAAFVGFVILLHLIFRMEAKNGNRQIFQGLAVILALFIILVHQVSIILIVILLFTLMICEYIVRDRKYISTIFVLYICVLFLGYWGYSALQFLAWFGRARWNIDFFEFEIKHTVLSDPTMDQTQVVLIYLYNNIPTSIFAAFAVTGAVYLIWRQKPKYLAVFGLFSLITLILYLPNPLFASETFAHLFRIDRFRILLSPIMTLAMASGFLLIYSHRGKRDVGKRIVRSILLIVFVCFAFFSLGTVVLTEDPGTQRLYFTSEEHTGFDFVFQSVPYGSALYSDYYTKRYFIQKKTDITEEFGLPYYQSGPLPGAIAIPRMEGYTILRNKQLLEYNLIFEENNARYSFRPTEKNIQLLSLSTDAANGVYSTGGLEIYQGLPE
ncbi:hypothetical protein [Methanofollis tationis]|uniref:DUF2206 domain-containing protein n=1 Tax=Methanofollis tationis TaxID=81417 RepID=A0A7K4HME9_9EURY|nr:hypothetical protein [Methanofollis tationis]NVO66058.1 hypothetical protein [Methanofollis tationis]